MIVHTLPNDCSLIEDVHRRRRSRAEFGLVVVLIHVRTPLENLMFVIMSTRENVCLIARTPLVLNPASKQILPSRVAQPVTCLATDVSLTADRGVGKLIPARSHTFAEIVHEIISTVILLPSAESFKKGCCQLQVKVCVQSTG